MDKVTRAVSLVARSKGISAHKISEKTAIPYDRVRRSLRPEGTRSLTPDEFFRICTFLEKDPMDFAKDLQPDNEPEKAS